jgi:murein DD-endopeptidase MepM/ murein hydrolase activator NlpD
MTVLSIALGLLVLGATAAPAAPGDMPEEASPTTEAFGISAEKYVVERGRVAEHQTFADVLTAHGGAYADAVRLAKAVRPAFDVRDLRAGQPYRIYVNPWLGEPQYLVYQVDAVRYVLFDVQRPARSRVGRRPVEREWTMVRGTIDNSLYETLAARNAHPTLALRLSEVFAWQIDFFRIRSGDSFRVLYERRSVNGEQVAPGKIIAARFAHRDRRYYGFRFDDGQGPQYFNRAGESLRRQLLKAPLRYSRISSGYSQSRLHPVLKERRPHHGTDYAAPTGTPVHSVGGGTILRARYDEHNGNYVKIRHNGVYTTGYLHLTAIADGIEPGAEVEQGETIGYVGSTGLSTGPHLDYRLWRRGAAVDPYEIELPPTRPVSPQHRPAYRRLVADRLDRLFPLRVFRRRGPALSSPDKVTAVVPRSTLTPGPLRAAEAPAG